MDNIKLKWLVDLLLGITFILCFVSGLLKYTVLLQLTGLSDVILPAALISTTSMTGPVLFLGLFVFLHLLLNRRWIISTTKKILSGSRGEP